MHNTEVEKQSAIAFESLDVIKRHLKLRSQRNRLFWFGSAVILLSIFLNTETMLFYWVMFLGFLGVFVYFVRETDEPTREIKKAQEAIDELVNLSSKYEQEMGDNYHPDADISLNTLKEMHRKYGGPSPWYVPGVSQYVRFP